MDGEKREFDEMTNFLAVGIQSLVTSCSESTLPPYGEIKPYRHMYCSYLRSMGCIH